MADYEVVHLDDVPVTDLSEVEGVPPDLDVRRVGDALGAEEMRATVWYFEPGEEIQYHAHGDQEELYYDLEGEFSLKLGKSGVLAAADIARIASAADLDLMVGCMLESAVGIHTSAHLVSGLGTFSHVDLDGNQLLAEDVVDRDRGPTIDVGGPGHGVSVPEDV